MSNEAFNISAAPSLISNLATWINESSTYKQPHLALAASISALSALKAHICATETNLRTNLLIVGLAQASSGKNHALDCIEALYSAVNQTNLLGGTPASDSALLSILSSNSGRSLILWDEFGLELMKMNSPKAPAYLRNILPTVMKLFSSAHKPYRGTHYADEKRQRVDISNPHLSIYGTSTPIRFHQALTSDFGSDGFLSRLMIFDCGETHPEPTKPTLSKEVPQTIIKEIKQHLASFVDTSEGNLVGIIAPKIVKLRDRAFVASELAMKHFWHRKVKEENEAIQNIYGRAHEHSLKLALTATPTLEISYDIMNWAVDLVSSCIDSLVSIVRDKIADNQNHRLRIRLTEIIQKHRVIDRGRLCQLTPWLTKRERNDMLSELIESEVIEIDLLPDSRKKKQVFKMKGISLTSNLGALN